MGGDTLRVCRQKLSLMDCDGHSQSDSGQAAQRKNEESPLCLQHHSHVSHQPSQEPHLFAGQNFPSGSVGVSLVSKG